MNHRGFERRRPVDAGVTLIEVLVALALFGLLGSMILAFGIATARVTDDTTDVVALDGEARVAFERLSRDLRDATLITRVQPAPASAGCGPDEFVGVSFIEGSDTAASDVPQRVAYSWGSDQQLILSEAVPHTEQQPILAATLSSFCVQLWSSRWGAVSWHDLGAVLTPSPTFEGWDCAPELGEVDRVTVTMRLDGDDGDYRTDVFLRNARTEGNDDVCTAG